ncbi:hypothetical protein M011DRAFT_251566 [Sporormia fimetaria CBS 119925]|uniref:F-box domain-containing protein n=1 Tax=Sporormia fimetaria CBS 119925 TaxID=1340428 RepID=A0A6A6UXB4_9PLEO|nr:hypothetical protein M011DRAFT_251566 [Sporormia fimetaria CBS 119925]
MARKTTISPQSNGPNLFQRMPAELLLMIIKYLRPGDWLELSLAYYHTFQAHGLVPKLTRENYLRATLPRLVHASLTPQMPGAFPVLQRFPLELFECVCDYLEPHDIIAFMFSHRSMMWAFGGRRVPVGHHRFLQDFVDHGLGEKATTQNGQARASQSL